MIRRILLTLALGLTLPCLAMAAVAGQPVDVLPPQVCQSPNGQPEICRDKQTDKDDAQSPVIRLMDTIMNVLALIIGVVAVIVIVISGLRFVVSAGDSNAISSARRSLLYAIVGLTIAIAARTLVRFILSKL